MDRLSSSIADQASDPKARPDRDEPGKVSASALQNAGARTIEHAKNQEIESASESAGQAPLDFVAGDKRVAIVVGPEIRSLDGASEGGMLIGYGMRAQRERPDATVINHKQLGPHILHGFDSVVLITHGKPGLLMWGGDKIVNAEGEKRLPGYREVDGAEMAKILRAAGFNGRHVLLEACNGGTDTEVGRSVGSSAAAMSKGLSSEVLAARADDQWKSFPIHGDTIFELLQAGMPRIVGPDDVGSVIVDKAKERILGEVTRAELGTDLSKHYPDAYLANEATGTVLSTGSLASDLDGREEPMVTRIPHGHWVVYQKDGSHRLYTKKK